MSNFKRFNSSDNINNYDSSFVGREGELTWDSSNGLRIHDGSTSGGNPIGGSFPVNQGGGALNSFLFGGATSDNNGKVLTQNTNLDAEWSTVSYNNLTDKPTIPSDVADLSDNSGLFGFASTTNTNYTVLATISNGITINGDVTGIFYTGDVFKFSSNATGEFQIATRDYDGDNNWTNIVFVDATDLGSVDGDQIFTVLKHVTEIYAGSGISLSVQDLTSKKVLTVSANPAVNEGSDIRDYGAEANAGAGNILIDNLNYKRHWLLNINGNPGAALMYVLGNGNEGDVIYFMPGSQFNPSQNLLQVSNFEYYNSANSRFEFKSGIVQLFSIASGNTESVVRATWSYNAWHFSGPVTIVS